MWSRPWVAGMLLVILCGCLSSAGPGGWGPIPDDGGGCAPNTRRGCVCAGAAPGEQTCREDGAGWGACACPLPGDDAGVVVTPRDAGACPSGALCGGVCVDTLRDPRNCGACGRACEGGASCDGGACARASAAVQVSWTFPGVWERRNGERWLPTYLLHLYGSTRPVDGPFRLDVACATLRNTGASAQGVTLRVSLPGYGAERTSAVTVSPGQSVTQCLNPAWDLPRLYALRSLTPMGVEASAVAGDGAVLSTAMRSVSALPGNSFALDQSYEAGLTRTARETYGVMGAYASVFVMPNDPTVTTVRRAVEARSGFGGTFGVIGWNRTGQRYREDGVVSSAHALGVGAQSWWKIYLEAGEAFSWRASSVVGGSDADIDLYLFTEPQYADWNDRGATVATWTWRDQRSGATGSYTAPAAGWYRLVLFNTADNFVSRSVSLQRTATRGEVVWDALAAIFNELRARGVIYRNISPGYFEGYQNISLPRESVAMRAANCFDGTLLFASILENIGFEPVIRLVRGHAYIGVRSAPASSGLGVTWFLETTMVGTTTASWFDALVCGLDSCVVPGRDAEVDVPVLPLRALGVRAIPF